MASVSDKYDEPSSNNSSLELDQMSSSVKTNNSEHGHNSDGKGDGAESVAGDDQKKSGGTLVNAGAVKGLLAFSILFLACLAAFSSRLFAVIRFESIIHEFDPWYVL